MRIPLIVIVSAILTGCAARPAAVPEAEVERLTLSVGGRTLIDARVEGTTLRGVRHDLQHFDDGYRGQSRRGLVFLSEHSPGRISGVIGNGMITSVDYDAEASGRVHAQGRWASYYFAVDIDRNQVSVSDAYCTDTYRRIDADSDAFEGTSECWYTGHSKVLMHIPDAFFQRPVGEQVVFLTAFLG